MTASTVSSAEPSLKRFPYAGWIPSANGRLSFRHIGESRNPSEAIYANVATNARRIILGYQRRDLSDLLFQTIIHYLCNIEDRFWFAIAATSSGTASDADEIAGRVYIYKSKEDWRSKAQPVVRTSINQLNNSRLWLQDNRDQLVDQEFDRAKAVLDFTADVHADFLICRTGEVYVAPASFSDSELEYASIDYATSVRQDFPKWILDQCYFFLRDIAHRHQHHAPSSDTILILQHRDPPGVIWRRNIIFSLHHYIIRTRRFGDIRSLYQASGILAYCNSFRMICERHLSAQLASQIPPFNDKSLRQSLEARSREQEQRIAALGTQAIIRLSKRTVGISVFAVAIAVLIMLLQPQFEKGEIPELTAVGNVIRGHLLGTISTLFTSLCIIWIFTSDRWIEWRFSRDVLEAANVRRRGAAFVFFLLGLAVIAFTAWLALPAYHDAYTIFWGLLRAIRGR